MSRHILQAVFLMTVSFCQLFSVSADNFGVLLDAGSTSTKLKIYRWSPGATVESLPVIDLIKSIRFRPGLGSFEDIPTEIPAYLKKILDAAKAEVPQVHQASAPIHLMATAGLRFLTADDAKELITASKNFLADRSNNPFQYQPTDVTVLSGEEEAVYSWIALNYLLGFFSTSRPATETHGVLEMGGGSTQIAFIPNEPLFSEEFHVTINEQLYQLYAQSYLQFGANGIKLQIASKLASSAPNGDVMNPCLLKNDTLTTTLENGTDVIQSGTGNPQECLAILQNILRPDTGLQCEPKPCAIGSVYQPSVSGSKFYATQVFTYAPKSLNILGADEILHLDQMKQAAEQKCTKTIEEVVAAGESRKYASQNCLMAMYIVTLFTESYGFPIDTNNIKATGKVGEQSIDWALGAMLIELSTRFHSHKRAFAVRRR